MKTPFCARPCGQHAIDTRANQRLCGWPLQCLPAPRQRQSPASSTPLPPMQLPLTQLPAHLTQGLRPLYVLHGDEPLLAQEAQDAIRAAARAAGHAERSVHTVMGAHFDWSAPLAAGQSLSLFAQKQIVEIRIPSGKPGKEGSAALQQLAAQIAGQAAQATPNAPGPGVLTLITLPL